MNAQKKPLAIVTAIDQCGAPAASLAMSINEHNSKHDYEIIVFQQELNELDLKAFTAIPRVQVRRHDFPSGFVEHMLKIASPTSKIRNRKSLMPFCHFEAFKMLESYRRVIWLDSDILVQKSLDELFDGNIFTATTDDPWSVGANFLAAVEGYDMAREGLCSAVLGLSDKLPYQDIYHWCFDEATRLSPVLYNRDQGIINLALQHFDIKARWLNYTKWQCMPWRPEASAAHIIHFGGHQKPWENPDIADKWPAWQKYYSQWLALGSSPFYSSPSIDISSKSFLTDSYREKYLRLESPKIDGRLKSVDKDANRESENTAIKIQRSEQIEASDYQLDSSSPWILPRNRRVNSLKQALQSEAEKIPDILCSLNPNKPQVAAVFGGGLGDALKFTSILPHLVERLGCDITVICDQQAIHDLKTYNPYITNFVLIPGNPYEFVENVLQYTEVFDTILIYRYTIRYLTHASSKISEEILKPLIIHSEDHNKDFNRYNFSNRVWPSMNNAFAREMGKQNKGVLQTLFSSTGLKHSETEAFLIPLFLSPPEDDSMLSFLSTPYVTIHHGFDVRKLPAKTKKTDYNSTKNLTSEKWIKIVAAIRSYGIKVIQLGNSNEEIVEGVDYSLNGSTTLNQTAMVLKNALCHLDTEGGLVHLNRAVHGNSVVMFGPTPVKTFGYPQNINLAPSSCKECFWTTQTWVLECPRETSGPECMSVYEPERVAATVAATIAKQRKTGVEVVQSSSDSKLTGLPELLSSIASSPSADNAQNMILCSESNVDMLKELLGEFAERFHFYATDVLDPAALDPNCTDLRVGSFVNMNVETNKFKIVVCVTEAWVGTGGPFIMSEMLRVLQPGGLLVGICPEPFEELKNLKSLFKDYRLELKEDKNQAHIRSFVLRKDYLKKSPIPLPAIKYLPYKDEYPSSPAKFSKRVEELHNDANTRLDKIHEQFNILTDNVNKAWEVSDLMIRNSLPPEGWISVSSQVAESYGSKFLLKGWYEPEDWGCWGSGFEHSLILPTDSFVSPKECFIFEAEIDLRLGPNLPKRKISLSINELPALDATAQYQPDGNGDSLILKLSMFPQGLIHSRFIILNFKIDNFFIPSTCSPESADHRSIGIGLRRFRYRFDNTVTQSNSTNQTESLGNPPNEKYSSQWLALGGSPFYSSPSIDISSKNFLTDSYREKYLRLESPKIDERLKSVDKDANSESENTAIKIQRSEQIEASDYQLDSSSPWILPRNRRVNSLKQALQREAEKIPGILCSLNPNKPQVAAVFGGGLGDALKFTSILPHLVERLGCDITVICDQQAIHDLKTYNPYITNFVLIPGNPYEFVENVLQYTEVFDAILIYRYTIRYLTHASSKIPEEILKPLIIHSEDHNKDFNRYNFSNRVWPSMNNAFAREMGKQNKGVLQTLFSSTGLKHSETEAFLIPFFLSPPEDESMLSFLSTPYVTIHHGFDVRELPAKTKKTDYNSTKNLTSEKWIKIVAAIKSYGIKVIQLGNSNEEIVKGVDYSLNGSTTLNQTSMVLKNALCHLDTEGGLVHLNRAVHGNSVVMFGPTPVKTFGYPQNINLAPSSCKECFWTTETWLLECPRETSGPECMSVYEPERVSATVAATIANQRKTGVEVVQSSSDSKLTGLPELLSSIASSPNHDNAQNMILCSESNVDMLKELLGEFAERFHFYATDVLDPAALNPNCTDIRVGSFVNMNVETNRFKIVVCVTEAWVGTGGPFIMSEMLRVLQPGGLLVGICPEPFEELKNLKSLFKDYRLELKEDKNQAHIRSFVLRKDYLKKSPIPLPAIKYLPYKDEYPSSPAKFSKRVEELHNDANTRLDKIHEQFNILTDNVNKAWEVSDLMIRNSLPPEGWISVSSQVAESYGSKFLLKGWYEPEDWGCWGSGFEHSLILPTDSFVSPKECFIFEAEINLRLGPNLPKRKISLSINELPALDATAQYQPDVNGDPLILKLSMFPQGLIHSRFIILNFKIDNFFIPSTCSPESADHRSIGIGLRRFRYRFDNTETQSDSTIQIESLGNSLSKTYSQKTSLFSRGKKYLKQKIK